MNTAVTIQRNPYQRGYINVSALKYVKGHKYKSVNRDLYSRYVATLKETLSERSVETYKKALTQFMKWLYVNGITQPQRGDIIAYREWLKEERKPSTVQAYITAVKVFFTWTESENLYPNVADHIKGAKLDKWHKQKYLTPTQIKRILQCAKGDDLESLRTYALLALLFTTGLRTVEVSRAKVKDLDSLGDETVIYVQGKGHEEKAEYVKVPAPAEDALRAYFKARDAKAEEPLFTSTSNNSKGKTLSTKTISSIVKKAFIKAGYNDDRYTAHSARHSMVTIALMNGEKLEDVQQQARHKSLATTLIYADELNMAKNTCSRTVADAIF